MGAEIARHQHHRPVTEIDQIGWALGLLGLSPFGGCGAVQHPQRGAAQRHTHHHNQGDESFPQGHPLPFAAFPRCYGRLKLPTSSICDDQRNRSIGVTGPIR